MGSISIQVVGDAAIGTKSKTLTVSNANITRLITWAQAMGGPGGGSLTPAQAFDRWVDFVMDQTKAHLIQRERSDAAIPPFDAA